MKIDNLKNNLAVATEFVDSCEKTVSRLLGRKVKLIMNIEYYDAMYLPVKLDQAIKLVADILEVDIYELKTSSRKVHLVNARAIACRLAKDNIICTLKQIGEALGGRDHTTVMNAIQNSKDWEESDKQFSNDLHRCQEAYNYIQSQSITPNIPCLPTSSISIN